MAKQPAVLRNYNLFVNGSNFAGLVDEVTLPSLKIVFDEHRAGGMDAPVAIDLGMERLELKFVMAEHSADVFRQFGLISGTEVTLLFRAALKSDGEAAFPYFVTVKGMYTDITPGVAKVREKSTLEATVSCRAYKLQLRDKTILDIDVDNFRRVVDGVDQLEELRNILDA